MEGMGKRKTTGDGGPYMVIRTNTMWMGESARRQVRADGDIGPYGGGFGTRPYERAGRCP